jgi:protein-S-isoprenylcysteine O-methyltransferase Ste14
VCRWAGVGFLIFTALLLLWTFRHLGSNLTDTVVTRQQHTLVLTGPYCRVRHPFSVSAFFGSLGNSLLTANGFLFLVGELVFLWLYRRTGIEEDKLVERLGSAYQHYIERTGRFLPRLWD